jgi:CheY-like chemotaxis protein
MNIVCAKCGAGVSYERSSLADQTVVVCSTCRSGLKVRIEAFEVPAAASSPAEVPVASTRERAVVAVQGEATRELIRDLLSSAGFDVVEVTSGSETLAAVRDTRPAVVLVDVGLSDMPGFQVCEAVRGDSTNAGVRIILVAAIHNKDRYRRPPDNLFGADDYVERHQIESELVDKVKRVLAGETPGGGVSGKSARVPEPELARPATSPDKPVTPALSPPAGVGAITAGAGATVASEPPAMPLRESTPPAPVVVRPAPAAPVAAPRAPAALQPAAEAPAPGPTTSANPAQEAALRLARIIVSDIALYNAKKVDEGVMNGTFFELLRTEIEEGRKLYEERKGPGLTTTVDLFQQTIEQFVATRRELLKRNRPAAA